MRARIAAVSLLLLIAAVPAAAQRQEDALKEIAQEFFITATVYPQGAGEVQLTVDSDLSDENPARLTAEYGITGRLEVMATTPPLGDRGGGSEWSVGARYSLLNTRALAASAEVDAKFTSAKDVTLAPSLIAARDVAGVQVHGTVAAALAAETEYFSGLGVMMDGGRLTPTLELTASGREHAETTIGLTPGLYLHLARHVEIGAAAPVRLHGHDLPGLRAIAVVELF